VLKNAVACAKVRHEGGQFGERHCRMMSHALTGATLGQGLAVFHPLNNPLNTLLHPLSGFSLGCPNGQERLGNQSAVNLGNGASA
jgi:hypothetical protein